MSKSIYRTPQAQEAIRRWCTDQFDSWKVPHKSRVIQAQGADTHVIIAGTGPISVVFVAGDRFSAAACLPLLTALSKKYRVIAADVPGQPGLSSGNVSRARGRLDWYGSWLNQVVEQTTAETELVVVLGHSFGGAVTLAATSPRIRARVAISTGGLCKVRPPLPVLWAFISWLIRPKTSTSTRLLQHLLAPGHAPRPQLVEWMTLVARHTRPISSSDILHAPVSPAPTVIATGEYDVFLPPQKLAPAAQRVLGVAVDTIPEAGHLVVDERPEYVVDLITKNFHLDPENAHSRVAEDLVAELTASK